VAGGVQVAPPSMSMSISIPRLLFLSLCLGFPFAGSAAADDAPTEEPAVVQPALTAKLYPAPVQNKERLRRLIIELWCAERGGADDQTLMRLYLKHSYPPLGHRWHNVWNRALEDAAWVRSVYDEVRKTCPVPEDSRPPGIKE